jgi:hypothetical protein
MPGSSTAKDVCNKFMPGWPAVSELLPRWAKKVIHALCITDDTYLSMAAVGQLPQQA